MRHLDHDDNWRCGAEIRVGRHILMTYAEELVRKAWLLWRRL